MNLCIFEGNLVKDPVVNQVNGKNGDNTVAKFSLGVNDRQRKRTTFPQFEAWGKTAELIGQYFTKGSPIRVYSRLETDTWQDKNTGENRYRDKYTVEKFDFPIGGKKGENGKEGGEGEAEAETETEVEVETEGTTAPEAAAPSPKRGRKAATTGAAAEPTIKF